MNLGSIDRAAGFLDAVTAPLDEVRQAALAAATKSRKLTRIIARQDTRVPFIATLQILALFAVTAVRPLWLFVLGPIVLGIPHLASDARYLLIRQRVAREIVFVSIAAALVFVGIQTLSIFHAAPAHWTGLEIVTATAWIGAAVAAGARERKNRALLFWLVPLVAFGAFATWHAAMTRIVFAHLHNVIGVTAWILLFRKNRKAAILPALALVLGVGLLVSGATFALSANAFRGFGFDLSVIGRSLAPGASPSLAAGAALSFVFLQSVHYAAWLVWIPQDNLPGQGTFTFRMTARSLRADFGIALLVLIAALALALAGAAAFDPHQAVRTYMSLATFHGYFEIAILAYFAARQDARQVSARAGQRRESLAT
ncbi:MAG: hypothetical protein ACRELY_22985 [Polyangiaceae bacterium]